MKISAKGGGGFSGQSEQYQIDTAQSANGPELEALLRKVDFFRAAPPSPIGADIPRWEITVANGQHNRTVTFAEDGSPESANWQALIAHLRNTG